MTNPTLTSTIARLRALEAKATPGPWSFGAKSETDEGVLTGPDGADLRKIDAKLMVALRNALSALLDAAERAEKAEAERDRLRARLAVSEPVRKAVERILDDHSAWIARPSSAVTDAVALRAVVAAHFIMEKRDAAMAALAAERDRLAARVAELEVALRLSRGLLEAVRDNDPNDMAADAVPVHAVWRSEAQRILTLLEPKS